MKKLRTFSASVLGTLFLGGIFGILSGSFSPIYERLILPRPAPQGWAFPIVWSVLYIMMGVSLYLIRRSESTDKSDATKLYLKQLFVNLVWPVIFFKTGWFLAAFIWILVLWLLVFVMIFDFYRINKGAAYFIIPYFIWVSFAVYLNLAVYILNR